MPKPSKDGDNKPKVGTIGPYTFGKPKKQSFGSNKVAAKVGLSPFAPSGVSKSPKSKVKPTEETSSTSAAPQLTRAGAKPGKPMEPGKGHHSAKWDSCVQDVKKKGSADNPYAVCTTSVPQAKKQSKRVMASQRGSMNFMGHLTAQLQEAGAQHDAHKGRRFRVTLLQEGLGNFDTCFYYTAEAIQSAVKLYEGAKAFIDHPSETEETDRPERSVRDIFGYFENVGIDIQKDGRNNLCADLVTMIDPNFTTARTLMLESLSFSQSHPGQSLVGLSINASGDFKSMPLDQFMSEIPIPQSCKDKLFEARERGISVIRPVLEMKTAVSCDLVTTAGAGGSIKQLLEGDITMRKEAKIQEDGAMMPTPANQDDNDQLGDHPNADQDQELIMNILKKYLGDGFSDDDKAMAQEHYQNALEMGMEGKDAMACAGHSMQMAKHMQKKQAEMPQSGKIDDAALHTKSPDPVSTGGDMTKKDQFEDETGDGMNAPASGMSGKQSDRGNRVVALVGEVARLRQEIDAWKLRDHTEKVLRESKLPMQATKKFRECLKGVKSIKEVNEKLALFKEAFSLRGEASDGSFIIQAEKQSDVESGSDLDFSDCVET